jgi:hypothetical protein
MKRGGLRDRRCNQIVRWAEGPRALRAHPSSSQPNVSEPTANLLPEPTMPVYPTSDGRLKRPRNCRWLTAVQRTRFISDHKRRCQVLNSSGLRATYSAQSFLIIRCTSSELNPISLGCLLPSWPMRKIPEFPGVWRKGSFGRLMDDPLRGNIELVSPD